MSRDKRILFVTEKFPWPLDDGGQIRTYQILKSLSAKFPMTLLSTSPLVPILEDPIRALGIEVVTVSRRAPSWTFPWRVVEALFTKRPYPLPKNFHAEILSEIRRQIISENVHFLHFNHLDAAQYVDELDAVRSSVKVIFDTHNVLTSLYSQFVNCERNLLRQAYSFIQWRKMRVYEVSTMRKADCVVVCSESERRLLQEWGMRSCLVVPNGVDTGYFASQGIGTKADGHPVHLVFTGAMDYLPNVQGIRWFFDSVVPELDRRLPSYKLTIVGKGPPADLLALGRPGKIEFTGWVDDVRPYTRSADVFVVPLQIGGGTRLKILEALAMQIPVVSTRIGAEGLELCDGVHLRLADDTFTMTQAIVDLCTQSACAREMARNGRQQVFERYDWKAVTYPLCHYYEESLNENYGSNTCNG